MLTRIKNQEKIVHDALDSLYNEVCALVKSQGGFIDTQNLEGKKGTIYGYKMDCYENCNEMFVYGLRINKNGGLEAALVPITRSYKLTLTPEDFKDEGIWDCVKNSETVFFAQTLLSIALSVKDYVVAPQEATS